MSLGGLRFLKLLDARSTRAALLVGFALPAAAMLGYVPGSPLREASACVPLPGARSGWQTLAFVHHAGEVATDGFIVIGGVSDLEDAELAASIQVAVTDESGAEVSGRVTLLSPNPDRAGRRFLGWSAAEPLAIGAKLVAELKTERVSIGTEVESLREELELRVVSEPTELSAGTPSFGDWGTFSHGVGESVTCMPGAAGCGQGLPPHDLPPPTNSGYGSVPSNEVRTRTAMTSWQPPEIRGNVAWEAAVVLVGDASGAILPDDRPLVFSDGSGAEAPSTGLLVFPAEPEDHCIALRVRDLRTGEEKQSEPVCSEPGASTFTIADTSLRNCAKPPNDALAKTWCEMHPGSWLEECKPGYRGSADSEDNAGGSGQDRTSRGTPPAATDSGCSLSRRTGSGALPALVGLAFALLRGRRRGRPGTLERRRKTAN